MSGGGGNEPNLTPFIDLFSVLICFLLMTAAWLSLESVQVQVEKKKDPSVSADPSDPTPPPDKEKKTKLAVLMSVGKTIVIENDRETPIPNQGTDFDEQQLAGVLARWRQQYPEKKDILLNTEASITYGSMIKMYDFLISKDWNDVGISPY
jgi:biopolymer transport protein TolR